MSDIGKGPLIPKNGGTGFVNSNASTIDLSSPVDGYVLTSDAVGKCTLQPLSSGSVVEIDGNTGTAIPSAGVITVTTGASNANGTAVFTGSSSTLTQTFTDANFNTGLGTGVLSNQTGTPQFNTAFGWEAMAGAFAAFSGSSNACFGQTTGNQLTSGSENAFFAGGGTTRNGSNNTACGVNSLNSNIDGSRNTAVGSGALGTSFFTSGSDNIAVGSQAGTAYDSTESSNIMIGNVGVNGESNKIRIGTDGNGAGQQDACYIAGIYGVSPSSPQMAIVNSSGQLGSVATVPIAQGGTNASSFTQSDGIVVYNGTSLVNYAGPQIDSSGIMTNSAQPSFLAFLTTTATDVTGDGTTYTIVFDQDTSPGFDRGSNYNAGTGVFTAPKTGVYSFGLNLVLTGVAAGNTFTVASVVVAGTSAETYNLTGFNGGTVSAGNTVRAAGSTLAFMTATDTAVFKINVAGTPKGVDVFGAASLASDASYVSGSFIG